MTKYRADIKELIKSGKSIGQLASFYNVSIPTIRKDLKKLGLKPPKSINNPVVDVRRLLKLKELLEVERTAPELCKKLKVSQVTLYRDFKRLEDMGCKVMRVGFSRPALYRLEEN